MKRYIKDLVRISLIMVACTGLPAVVVSLFGLHRENGWMLPIMCLGFAMAVFAMCMLPALRFWWMIRRQEKLGLPFPSEEPRRIDLGWSGTYITSDWLIYAGIHALHYSQITSIHGKRTNPGRNAPGHLIIVKTVNGRTHRWHLSQHNTKIIRDWLKAHQAAS